jgi:hypothetical protein
MKISASSLILAIASTLAVIGIAIYLFFPLSKLKSLAGRLAPRRRLALTGSTSNKHPFPECPREPRWQCRCMSRIRRSCVASG